MLINKGANVCCIADHEGVTLLHIATRIGNQNAVQRIPEHRADIHENGNTPLLKGAQKGALCADCVWLLLDCEASVDIENNDGKKPRQCA